MDYNELLSQMKAQGIVPSRVFENGREEVYLETGPSEFPRACLALHAALTSPVMMLFADDERQSTGKFGLYCVFAGPAYGKWFFVKREVGEKEASFDSLCREMHSATLFEREIKEMFGLEPLKSPDSRRLNLHDEVWPQGYYPLRNDFVPPENGGARKPEYRFRRIDGEGVFEVPVGPVHAGIIGPGHFRFSAAGEPVINLEIRLGFTHRGVEKVFEGKTPEEAAELSECVSGDAAFGHSLAFCRSVEKALGIEVPAKAEYLRALCLELERMCNHAADIGGIAVDAGFSFPSAYATLIKERLHALNEQLTGSRYLKGVNIAGGTRVDLDDEKKRVLAATLAEIRADFAELKEMLFSSVSFMDRVDSTGTLKTRTAQDLGVLGLAGRASGIDFDLRRDFPGVYGEAGFRAAGHTEGDVLARLKMRVEEFEESARLAGEFARLAHAGPTRAAEAGAKDGFGLGHAESWRGPVLYWTKIDAGGRIDRCKIVDPSFRNWQGLAFAVPGNIIPDFPLCNKSFDLSYPGNDL
ncbi:MAG: hydrogenase large subunit [Endomicrobiales bacterium]